MMIKSKIIGNEKIHKTLFTIGLWILILRQMSGMMASVPYFSLLAQRFGNEMLYLGIAILLFAIVLFRPTVMEILACIWGFVSCWISDNTMLLILLVIVIAGKGIGMRRCVKCWLIPVGTILLASIIGYVIALRQSSPIAVLYDGRWTFFYNHPNSFGLWFSFAILAVVYLVYCKKKTWYCVSILVAGAGFLWIWPNCKTDAVALLLLCGMVVIYRYFHKLWKTVTYITPLLAVGITGICTWLYSSGKILCDYYILQKTFSMRFQDAAIALSIAPPTLLGHPVTHLGEQVEFFGIVRVGLSLDNAYVASVLYYGLIGGILLIGAIVIGIYAKIRKEDEEINFQAMLLLTVFVMGMMEWPAWYGTIAFPLISLGDLNIKELRLYDKKKSKTA